ncbi:MAG: sugar ABC transporter permease [Sebaldella sp.]|nr:sugar ABC transporter permease [Sebaldella sp.]
MSKKYYFILPAVIFLFVFVGYPIIYNIWLSFQNLDVTNLRSGESKFVFISNYISLFKKPDIMNSIIVTFIFTVLSIGAQFILGFALALFFNQNFKLSHFIRGLLMVAWVIPITISALTNKFLFSLDGGLVNYILLKIGLLSQAHGWLVDSKTALLTVVLVNVWIGTPFNMILLLTGLSNIPDTLYESASIDGANYFQTLKSIVIPYIKPTIYSVLILGFIYTFKVFDLVLILTGGGPVNSTEVLSMMSYRQAFGEFNYSMGATVSNILFFILFFASLIYIKISKKED